MTTLGIVIVNYNSTDYLRECLKRVYQETVETDFHVVVVDNASSPQDFSEFEERYRKLSLVLNTSNQGFATACNQGIRHHRADFYLLLNPDCMVEDRATDRTVAFLRHRPEVGIAGCRVKNPDGTLQLACRRTIPRPSTAFYRFSGLSFLFPRSRKLAAYNLSYEDEERCHEVEAVSGSFLMVRHEVIEEIGYLDESFFLYGEDLDLCYRTRLKGWKVFYYPEAQATHLKRRSSSRNAALSNYHFYNAMKIFYRKHFSPRATLPERVLVSLGIDLLYLGRRLRAWWDRDPEVGSKR